MKCPYCGAEHPRDFGFCPRTGKELSLSSGVPERTKPAGQSLKFPCLVAAGGSAAVLLVALAAMLVFISSTHPQTPQLATAVARPLAASPSAPGRAPLETPSPVVFLTPTATGLATLVPVPVAPAQGLEKIVYVNESKIFSINADGSGETRLSTEHDFSEDPVFSPNGSRVAYNSEREMNWDIYVMGADGSRQTRLTTHPAYDVCPAWSPDGLKIAFTSFRDGNAEIYVMNADGSRQTRLTFFQAPDYCPAWSPDGGKIAFTSYRDGFEAVYVMDAGGGSQVRLTGSGSAPAWSPDGLQIAYQSYAQSGNQDIYVMQVDGSGVVRLTEDKAEDSSPVWLAGGQKIAFISQRGGQYGIYVMNADGSSQTQLHPTGDYFLFRTPPFYASITIQPALLQQPALPLP
jgi:Tol biopolymer transport system component